jgi:DNA-directed RNA polymerase sigma subunit (sigma70/sigma32)
VFGLGGDAEPKSHEIIASELNMSVDEVADIEQRAMNRLRHPSSE